ncbi:MAG TPA: flagellar hook-basal body complex protein [Xanthobacteraceae bacterium]|nr:flagellar hook-basal body complex protein [Xanthobacteraceae bacterium]
MGIFDALTTAVAGLQAQSFALQNISGNIANSQTTGYKETDTSFADLVSQAAPAEQTTDGVVATSVSTNTVQGSIQNTSVSTNMAINGDGFFVVAKPTGFTDNQPVFNGLTDYTRAGDFQLNASGNLVNAAGYYLMGIPVNPTTGNPEGNVPQVLQFNDNFVPAQETTQIQYEANLPSTPPALLDKSNFQSNPVAGAQIVGSGAALLPDAVATGTGTVGALTAGTALVNGDIYTVNDGTHTTSFTAGATSTLADLMNAINGGAADVKATLVGGQLVLTGTSPTASITVGGTGAASIGFPVTNDSFQPTDLLTQGAVTQGQTLTVSVGGGTPQTITFGTGVGQVATLAELQTAVQGLTGVIGSVDSAGDIDLTATNSTDSIVIGGTANAAEFGIQSTTALPTNGAVIGNDLTTFDDESIDGGSITAFDADGNPVNVDFRWAKISSSATGGTDAWQLFYQANTNATGTQVAWQNTGQTFTFNANGEMSPPLSGVTLQNLTVNGDSLGNVQLQFGNNGLTQFATTSTTAQVSQLQQNGFAAGQLQSVSVDSQNRVVGTFTNGQTVPLAEISLATFNGENSLQALNGGAYSATPESGPAILGATGSIEGNSLESSNVDIATQFSQLIVAQQAYSANARVMSTADQMIQSLLQVIQ